MRIAALLLLLHVTLGAALWVDREFQSALLGSEVELLVSDARDPFAVRDGGFEPNPNAYLYFHFSDRVYWLRLKVEAQQAQELFNKIQTAWIDQVDFYVLQEGRLVTHQRGGDHVGLEDFAYHSGGITFSHAIAAGVPQELYWRIEGKDALQIPLYLYSQKGFVKAQQAQSIMHGLMFGAMLLLALYAFSFFYLLRRKLYLYYGLYVLLFGLLNFSINGYARLYLWGDRIVFNELMYNLLMCGYMAFVALFARTFLETKRYHLGLDRVLRFAAYAYGAIALSTVVLPYHSVMEAGVYAAALLPFVMIIPGVMVWRRGNRFALFFIAGWVPYALFYILWAVAFFGYLPFNLFTANANMFGAVIEFVIFSFALSFRIHRIKIEKQRIENELEHSKALLGKDPLSGLWNRLHFDSLFQKMREEYQARRQSFAFLIADIDDFKAINDTWGHQHGDRVIQAISGVLIEQFRRECDRVFRLGGEEFGVIVCAKNPQEAVASAQRMIEAVAALRLPHPHNVFVSISAGVVVCDQSYPDAYTLYALADRQLYEAKKSGKNRVAHLIV
ncbi:MAG: GGDEF domain-containing protein [Campylobacterales bacterium]|nr:GGDEF domain-containing protein [Campylobacterales bacterium]